MNQWLAIINPVSGNGRAAKKWGAIQAALTESGISFDYEMTTPTRRGDILATQAIAKGYRHIIAIGGDGHLHDIVNGVMTPQDVSSSDIILAMIAMGTGNDWIRSSGVPADYPAAIDLIAKGHTTLCNAGIATYIHDGVTRQRYFHNIAGVGFDAYVVARNQNLKRYGAIAYLLGMLRCIFSYRLPVLRIQAGDTVIETPVYLVIAGIGRYCGGGMMLTPGANQTGDKLYVTVIKDFNKIDVIRYTHRLYSGSFIHLSKVQVIEATQVHIEVITATQPVYMETDGDIVGQRPFTLSLLPGALTFVTP